MVNLSTAEEWQRQSALLLQARPTTTRITTKYKIPNLELPKYQKPRKRKRDGDGEAEEKESGGPRIPRAALVLKTYDPESGVVLKFKTDRAADVGRLISGLGRLGRHMAALPEKVGDSAMEDAEPAEQGASAVVTAAPSKDGVAVTADKASHAVGGGGGAAGGKKKKKGKK
ncbi:hypothetical protein LTR17_007569 [Elasticomyces elasticus]|nr:hypothetical protein LTR17_007569 [Elasticomyces elasticus]